MPTYDATPIITELLEVKAMIRSLAEVTLTPEQKDAYREAIKVNRKYYLKEFQQVQEHIRGNSQDEGPTEEG